MKARLYKILLALDALGCTLISATAKPGEYISTYCYRRRKYRFERIINRIFKDPKHCEDCFTKQAPLLGLVRDKE